MKDDAIYVQHIQECIRRVEENTAVGTMPSWPRTRTRMPCCATCRRMAESTQRLSPGIKAGSPQVDWTALSGFRNVLVHNYLGIDLDHIWTIVEQDVPTLKAALTPPRS